MYEIKKIEKYFINEINERESYSKKLNKYVTIFDYIDKEALNDIDISHKEFITILKEKDKYEKMKEDIEEQKIVK